MTFLSRTRWRQALWLVGVVVASFGWALPARAQPAAEPPPGVQPQPDRTNAADQGPGASVTVSLDDPFIQTRLPFDVPFFLTGTVPATTNGLEVLVYRVSRREVVSDLMTNLQSTSNCRLNAAEGAAFRTGVADVVSRSSWRRGPSGGSFNVLVNALDPQRYYAFCFLSSGPVPLAEIEAPVRRILVDTLAAFVPRDAGDVTVALATAIKDRLTENIEKLGADRATRAVIPAGNIFHRDTVVARRTPWAVLVTELIEPYSAILRAGDTYEESLAEFAKALAAARAGAASGILTPQVLSALPATGARLPARDLALTSRTPLDLAPFGDAPVDTLRAFAAGARAANPAAANELDALAEAVEGLQDTARNYAIRYESLRTAAQRLVDFVALEARDVTVALGSSVLGADLARSTYVSLDAGIAYPWRLENLLFYAGTNVYFRPINKAAPLRYKGSLLHRFALTIGVTTTVSDDSRRAIDLRPTADDKTTSNSLLLGAGLRVTSSIRVGAGALVFKEKDPNPTITQTSVTATPYVSLAADVDVAAMFKSFFP